MADREKVALQPEPTLDQEVFLELMRTHEAYDTEAARFFKTFEVTAQQFNVLRILYVRGDGPGIACSQISKHLLNRVPDMTRLLDRLERAGLVERERCSSDRRVVRARLTAKGHTLVERIHEPLLAMHERLTGHLDATEGRELIRLLQKARTTGSRRSAA
ncbi:MAG: MarR family transcriptional regulator [Myxococcota bacterium]